MRTRKVSVTCDAQVMEISRSGVLAQTLKSKHGDDDLGDVRTRTAGTWSVTGQACSRHGRVTEVRETLKAGMPGKLAGGDTAEGRGTAAVLGNECPPPTVLTAPPSAQRRQRSLGLNHSDRYSNPDVH